MGAYNCGMLIFNVHICHMGSRKMKGTDSGMYHVARQLSNMVNITYIILAISPS